MSKVPSPATAFPEGVPRRACGGFCITRRWSSTRYEGRIVGASEQGHRLFVVVGVACHRHHRLLIVNRATGAACDPAQPPTHTHTKLGLLCSKLLISEQ